METEERVSSLKSFQYCTGRNLETGIKNVYIGQLKMLHRAADFSLDAGRSSDTIKVIREMYGISSTQNFPTNISDVYLIALNKLLTRNNLLLPHYNSE